MLTKESPYFRLSLNLYLKEKSKADPLVIFVLYNLILICYWNRTHSWSNLTVNKLGKGEGGVDPAVGVHNSIRNLRLKHGD